MIGIIVVTHSSMADGLKGAVEMIAGEQKLFFPVGYYVGYSLDDLSNSIIDIIDKNLCDKWIIFTDMFGATPTNVSSVITTQRDVIVITGVNLGMILEFIIKRDNSELTGTLDEVINVGKTGIKMITKDMIIKNIKE